MNPEGWSWAKITPAPSIRWIAIVGLGLLGAAGLRWLERRGAQRSSRSHVPALVALIAFAYLLQLGTLWLKHPNPEQLLLNRIADNNFTGYFSSALQIDDLSALFSEYDRTIRNPTYCSHCQTHPPGPVLFYWLMIRAVDHLPATWQQAIAQSLLADGRLRSPNLPPDAMIVALLSGNLILLAAAATVIPLYGLALRLGGQKLALPLTALGTVLPGLILMSPEFDQFYGTLAAGTLYLTLRGLDAQARHGWWGMSAGLLFAFSLYWSFGIWILTVPLVLLTLAAMAGLLGKYAANFGAMTTRLPTRSAIHWLLGLSLGTVVPWALLWKIGGFRLLSVLDAAREAHLNGITAVRPYMPWLVFNLVDFLQFVGLPVVFVTILTLFSRRSVANSAENRPTAAFSSVDRIRRAFGRLPIELNFYGVVFWGVVLALDLSGTTRGEVGRLWIFLMPLALLPIYYAAGRGRLSVLHIHLLLATQFIVGLLIGGNWLTP